jgi:hypothetical protein
MIFSRVPPCYNFYSNLGCLYPVACVRSGDGGFISVYASSLSYVNFAVLLYYYMFRSYDHLQAENILLARIRCQLSNPSE